MEYAFYLLSVFYSTITSLILLLLIIRWIFGLRERISINYTELLNKIVLALGTIFGALSVKELLETWHDDFAYEHFAFYNRGFGSYWWAYWIMMVSNIMRPNCFGSGFSGEMCTSLLQYAYSLTLECTLNEW